MQVGSGIGQNLPSCCEPMSQERPETYGEFRSQFNGVDGVFVAASSRCFSELSFYDACQPIVDLGFDRLEISLDERGNHLRPSEVVADPERFVKLYREHTRMSPVALSLETDVDADAFLALCRLSKLMKITQITLPAAQLGTPFNEEIDRLRNRITTANSSGIRLSLKTKTGHLTEDPQTAVELCQSVPGLGITLDVSYFHCGRYSNQSYDAVFPYVYHVQLRDSSPKELQVPVGLGDIDYGRIVAQLRRQNYTRALSVEVLPELITPECERGLELRKMRMLLETLL